MTMMVSIMFELLIVKDFFEKKKKIVFGYDEMINRLANTKLTVSSSKFIL